MFKNAKYESQGENLYNHKLFHANPCCVILPGPLLVHNIPQVFDVVASEKKDIRSPSTGVAYFTFYFFIINI